VVAVAVSQTVQLEALAVQVAQVLS